MSEEELYVGREQTGIKHFILRKYLGRFAHIIGFRWSTITYVDCFSGPWNVRSQELKDSSFAIALDELRKARATHQNRGKAVRLRCMFLEKDSGAYAKLKEFADQVQDVEIKTENSDLESSIGKILGFVKAGGTNSFPFVFIDPTGWTGFGMNLIAPLLRLKPGELLINFMTDYIRRFYWSRENATSLFGDSGPNPDLDRLREEDQEKVLAKAVGEQPSLATTEQEREDLLLGAYAQSVRMTGGFKYTCPAVVLYPQVDRSYFHLIYATRDRKGVEVFKQVEKQAMQVMEKTRAEAKERKRVKKTQQPGLFDAEFMPHSRPIDALRERYLASAKQRLVESLRAKGRIPFEEVWDLALGFPLVWDSDLKDWIREWKAEGLITIHGLKPRQKVPKLDEGNLLAWERGS